jgi:hypothetical protein
MSNRIKLQLQLIQRALEPGYKLRDTLRDGSLGDWDACELSLTKANDLTVDKLRGDDSAVWREHWSNSAASKQMLEIMRATVQAAPHVSAEGFGLVMSRLSCLTTIFNCSIQTLLRPPAWP